MKESENVSLFIASFYEKKFLEAVFFLFSRRNKLNTRLYEKIIHHYPIFSYWLFRQINAQQAKYVFYFIGDGMGVNQVQGTELYLGELEGKSVSHPYNLLSSPTQP